MTDFSDIIQPLADDRGLYGLQLGDRVLIVREDKAAECDNNRNTPGLFTRLPSGRESWTRGTTERGLCGDLTTRRRAWLGVPEGSDDITNELKVDPEARKRFFGAARYATGLINCRLRDLLQTIDPEKLALLRRYPLRFRGELYPVLCREGARAWQLAAVFPCLAAVVYCGEVAAYWNWRNPDAQERSAQARRLVQAGEPLRKVAACVGLPYTLRRLPPQLVNICDLDALKIIGARGVLLNCAPATLPKLRAWISAVEVAVKKGGPEFGLWTARNFAGLGHFREGPQLTADIGDFVRADWGRRIRNQLDPRQAALVCDLLAATGDDWLKDRLAAVLDRESEPDGLRGFSPAMGARALIQASDDWHELQALKEAKDVKFPPPWYSGGLVADFVIDPLVDPVKLTLAARRLHNCGTSYAQRVASGECFLYGVRQGGDLAAMLELQKGRPPRLVQLAGPFNRPVSKPLARAVRRWHAARIKTDGNGLQPRPAPKRKLATNEF